MTVIKAQDYLPRRSVQAASISENPVNIEDDQRDRRKVCRGPAGRSGSHQESTSYAKGGPALCAALGRATPARRASETRGSLRIDFAPMSLTTRSPTPFHGAPLPIIGKAT